MDLPGEAYLFNLSLLAITYAAVSALVMLLRQTMGGKISNFDIHLITAYVSGGFTIAVDAILPPLISLTGALPAILWGVASGLAAIVLAHLPGKHLSGDVEEARASQPPSWFFWISVSSALAVVLLAANAVLPIVAGYRRLFAIALTLSMAMLLWSFVRRIASLLGEKPGEDWDPKRG